MLDFDKMTVAEHEQYKEMQRKAEAFDRVVESYDYFNGYKVKDLQGIGMDVLGIVGKYRNDSGDEV